MYKKSLFSSGWLKKFLGVLAIAALMTPYSVLNWPQLVIAMDAAPITDSSEALFEEQSLRSYELSDAVVLGEEIQDTIISTQEEVDTDDEHSTSSNTPSPKNHLEKDEDLDLQSANRSISSMVLVDSFGSYCGDQIVNQDWEMCDGGASCTAQCQGVDVCTDKAFARVVVDSIQTRPEGDLSSDVYVGGNSGADIVPAGTWFLIHENGAPIVDDNMYTSDTTGYAFSAGIVVERGTNQIRLEVSGTNDESVAGEHVEGALEFFNTSATSQSNDSTGFIGNAVENPTDGNMAINADSDEYWLSGGASHFWLTVTTANDGFFTSYDAPATCPTEDPTRYREYCGDGVVNQDWEMCDGGASCTAQCQTADQCTDKAFAQVVFDTVENTGTGDMTNDVYLGSTDNVIPNGTWFLIGDSDASIVDPDIALYRDVKGLAVERTDGSVRVNQYAFHPSDGHEHTIGHINFFGGALSSIVSDISDDKMELTDADPHPEKDSMAVNGTAVDFEMHTTPKADGFYAYYNAPQMCDGGQGGGGDTDTDGDGVNDDTDNCVNDANEDQADEDGNGVGDACQLPGGGGGDTAGDNTSGTGGHSHNNGDDDDDNGSSGSNGGNNNSNDDDTTDSSTPGTVLAALTGPNAGGEVLGTSSSTGEVLAETGVDFSPFTFFALGMLAVLYIVRPRKIIS